MAAEDQPEVGIVGKELLFQILARAGEAPFGRQEAVDQQYPRVIRIHLQHPLHPGEILAVRLPPHAEQQKVLTGGRDGVVPADPVPIEQVPLLGGAEAVAQEGGVIRLVRPHVVVPRHAPQGELVLDEADGGPGVVPVALLASVVHQIPGHEHPQGVLLMAAVCHIGKDLVVHIGVPVGVDLGVADPVQGEGRGLRRRRWGGRGRGRRGGRGGGRGGGCGLQAGLPGSLEPDLHPHGRLSAAVLGGGLLGVAAEDGEGQ